MLAEITVKQELPYSNKWHIIRITMILILIIRIRNLINLIIKIWQNNHLLHGNFLRK